MNNLKIILLLLMSFFGMARAYVGGVCHKSFNGLCCDTVFGPNCGKEREFAYNVYSQKCKTKKDAAIVCTTDSSDFKYNFNDAAKWGVKQPLPEVEEYTFLSSMHEATKEVNIDRLSGIKP